MKAILLCGSETWRTPTCKRMTQKLQSFVNKCSRQVLKISWTDRVTYEMLLVRAGKKLIEIQILRRKWRWIGHTLRKLANSMTQQTWCWNPQGKRERDCPRNSWRRDVESEMRKWDHTWTCWGGLPRTEANGKLNWSMAYASAGAKGQIIIFDLRNNRIPYITTQLDEYFIGME